MADKTSHLIILHTNDIHGRIEALSRIATLAQRIRADNPGVPVLYFDLGDSEDYSNRLSSLTKGVAMHRLLSALGCDAAVVGNGALPRYGPGVLKDHASASRYPHLLANLRLADDGLIPGTRPTALLDLGGVRLGFIGVTVEMPSYTRFFGLRAVPTLPLVRELAAELRSEGADAVILLSHLGLEADRELAEALQGEVALIVGGHSHDLLPQGEWVGDAAALTGDAAALTGDAAALTGDAASLTGGMLIAQAGQYAEHLGRIDLVWDGERLTATRAAVLLVEEATRPSARMLAETEAIEADVEQYLDEVIGELDQRLDFAADRPCGVAQLLAHALRERMDADVGVLVAGQAFSGPLPAGPLRRGVLWDACPSPANPGLVTLTGAQLAELVTRGLDAERRRRATASPPWQGPRPDAPQRGGGARWPSAGGRAASRAAARVPRGWQRFRIRACLGIHGRRMAPESELRRAHHPARSAGGVLGRPRTGHDSGFRICKRAVPQNLLCADGASVGRVGLERSGRPYRDHASGSGHEFCTAKPRLGLDTRLWRYSTGGARLCPIAGRRLGWTCLDGGDRDARSWYETAPCLTRRQPALRWLGA